MSYLYCNGLNHIYFHAIAKKLVLNVGDFEVLDPFLGIKMRYEVKFQITSKQSCNE